MVRSTAIPLLILTGMTLTPTEVGAASTTYYVVNYPALQNGYDVTGTITMNGTTGTLLPGTDITSWDINITKGGTAVATFNPSDSVNNTTVFDATLTTISVATIPDSVAFIKSGLSGEIIWTNRNPQPIPPTYAASSAPTLLWSAQLPTIGSPVATVPEPSSAVLASIGAVVAFLAYGWSRHRRVQHRREAD
jgi:hypothetical protein